MNISGEITGIKYKILLSDNLKQIDFNNFDINDVPATCLLTNNKTTFAISKWVSPKRTRSYPFERVYNSLTTSKKITIIPIVKDEGARGDRDFIQWDTVSLMSLLDVFVIFAYYDKAEVNPRNELKITNQQFDNAYVIAKIKEIQAYHSSALHWNLNELKTNLHDIIDKTKSAYKKIEQTTKVPLHNLTGIDNFKEKIGLEVELFMEFSRKKAKQAQFREFVTQQPKESLSTLSKAKITITNYLGGQYFFTVDEILIDENTVYLIEGKHSKNAILPSKGDIKDGLLKMILYSNLSDVTASGKLMNSVAVLSLTSSKLKGHITSKSSTKDIVNFQRDNEIFNQQAVLFGDLLREAEENNFIIKIGFSK
ncbi:hypothetical protein A9P82_15215 [Arachidicoccus ginsenosidimutans]|uniref:hypothetical protein n=1 Tax=Arachidicoccus sp. BS20 TaxID=1850526 RepID=UPI0007F16B42|nr:hypothetical protein [Arachidicoccus sp. BS20]ANI90519.1 hypothetical protein A9P82_15215 [Arachidicoccus sp. BS20]